MVLKSVIGLGYGIRVSSDCLGQDFASNIGGLDVIVRFPMIAPSPRRTNRQRLLAPAEYDHRQNGLPLKIWNYPTADPADEVDWGFLTPPAKSLSGSTGHPVARVNSALLLVSVPNGVEPTSVAYKVNDARNSWWGLLDDWIWCLSEQSVSQEPELASPLDPPLSFWSHTDRRRTQNGSVVASDSITLMRHRLRFRATVFNRVYIDQERTNCNRTVGCPCAGLSTLQGKTIGEWPCQKREPH